jgi:hypothetical protein
MGFTKATKQVAFAKIGGFGPTGSGKTTLLAMLLLYLSKEFHGGKPVAFLDTEKGSDFVLPFFETEGVELLVNKTRSFADLRNAHAEALKLGACALGCDSLTHFWQELLSSLKTAKNVKRLDIGMIGEAKDAWHQFTENFIHSQIHYLIAGRQGNEWENLDVEQDDGRIKNELIKGGTKMKAEGDTGYETDLLLELSSADDPTSLTDYKKYKGGRIKALASKQVHLAIVKKCRVRELNGQIFSWPDKAKYEKGDYKAIAECFSPYFKFLNIGGQHVAFDGSRNSQELFAADKNPYYQQKQRKEIATEEIKNSLGCVWTAATGKDASVKTEVINALFGTHSWTAVEKLDVQPLEFGAQICRRMKDLAFVKMPADRAELLALVEQAKQEVRDEQQSPVKKPNGAVPAVQPPLTTEEEALPF